MKKLLTICIIVVSVVKAKQRSEDEQNRILIQTSRGAINGFHVENEKYKNDAYHGNGGDVFLGIPYAHPPINENRFQKSLLIERYKETIEANRYGKICPQINGEKHSEKYDTGMDEDCLTLNIFAPNVSDTLKKYPVMVFIHGGALKFGDVAEWDYHGIVSNLVGRGVIWVSFNYRLGLFGFFTTNTSQFVPNRGIWDQITALRWIHEEIHHFGGDRDRVTLIGHSAGACSASLLALSPAVDKKLFQQIILLSCSAEVCFDGLYGKFTQSIDRAKQICNINARDEGWSDANAMKMMNCLGQLNYSQITSYDTEPLRWNVVLDGELFNDVPMRMRRRRIPILMGSTKDEYAVFIQWSLASGQTTINDYTYEKCLSSIYYWVAKIVGDKRANDCMELIYSVYDKPHINRNNLYYIQYIVRVLSDLIYIRAVGEEAEAYLSMGNTNVWLWQIDLATDSFSYFKLPTYKPSFHGIELFLLMQPDESRLDENSWGRREIEAAEVITEQFTEFAKTGEPSSAEWKRSNLQEMNYWKIGGDSPSIIRMKQGYGGKKYRFWKELIKLIQLFNETSNLSDQQNPPGNQSIHSEL